MELYEAGYYTRLYERWRSNASYLQETPPPQLVRVPSLESGDSHAYMYWLPARESLFFLTTSIRTGICNAKGPQYYSLSLGSVLSQFRPKAYSLGQV